MLSASITRRKEEEKATQLTTSTSSKRLLHHHPKNRCLFPRNCRHRAIETHNIHPDCSVDNPLLFERMMNSFYALLVTCMFVVLERSAAFSVPNSSTAVVRTLSPSSSSRTRTCSSFILQSSADATVEEVDFEAPEDAVINIKPNAMRRLRELREKEKSTSLVLRMGVRNGGCSGLSYVMDFSTEDEIQEDDAIDEYPGEKLKCVVDAKSMLYLYGLELDYSDELIGGGFKFFNPNAEENCGCGSSFGV